MVSRNAFRVRASEHLEDDYDFLSLFGLGSLDIFDPDNMWTKIQIIRSARGGGKTSILRIFSPKSLNQIYDSHTNDEDIKHLYKKLEELDVLSDSGIKVLGVNLSLFGNYTIISQLDFEPTKQNKLFFSLLTSRIFIATLRSICELKRLKFPDELDKIKIGNPGEPNIPTAIPVPCSGKDLYQWAESLEQKISNIIEEDYEDDKQLSGYETLTALHIIRSKNMYYENVQVAERTLLMLDDVDKLTSKQRENLSSALVNLRIPMGVWLAERLESLRPEELLSPIGTWGREYDQPITLEKFWRDNPKKFETLLSDISDKRSNWNRKYNITAFDRHLSATLEDKWNSKFNEIITTQKEKLIKKFGNYSKYRFLFDRCENLDESPSKVAEDWRLLEILFERDIRKPQKELFENITLTEDDFKNRLTSKEKEVAEYYVRVKNSIPYYFGFPNLVKLASSNIQQFLDLASDLFDEMISAKSLDIRPNITPTRQEQILEKSANRRWTEINQSISNSEHIVIFLNTLAKFCDEETNLPNSPYASVTGIALSTRDVKRLQDPRILASNPRYRLLSEVIATCLAHNLLESLPDSRQGKRDSTHLILYLNRLLCLKYQLPLPYGGWREQSLDTLCTFVENTYKSKRKEYVDFGRQQIMGVSEEEK